MKFQEIERWALSVLERVTTGGHVEDARVELKAEWPPDPSKAARRIAGHANAARGAPILWLIGVDEKNQRVVGASQQDFSSWWSSVRASFDGVWPHVSDVVVPFGDVSVIAMLFETDRAPFVVRNSAGGHIKFEVPWREATGVRTARREDLVRILIPTLLVPDHDVLSASISEINRAKSSNATVKLGHLRVDLCVIPRTEALVNVLFYRCEAKFRVGAAGWNQLDNIMLFAPGAPGSGDYVLRAIRWSPHEARIDGPVRVGLSGDFAYTAIQAVQQQIATGDRCLEIVASLPVVGADVPIKIDTRLSRFNGAEGCIGQWAMDR